MTNPVHWFEIPVVELDRAKAFYRAALGVEFSDMEMGPSKLSCFPMERGAAGATGALILSEGYTPSQEGSVVYFTVSQIDPTLAAIQKAGGKTLAPRMSIGEYGFIAHFVDSEGNRVALHEAPTE